MVEGFQVTIFPRLTIGVAGIPTISPLWFVAGILAALGSLALAACLGAGICLLIAALVA